MSATLLLALALGSAIGVTLGVLGGGGAILTVPVFVGLLGQDAHTATTSSLVVVGLAASVAAIRHTEMHNVCWRAALLFATAAIPGAVIGSLANAAVSGRIVLWSLSALIVVVAVVTWQRARSPVSDDGVGACPPLAPLRVLAAGAALGLLTGFFGVGGGFAIVPALAIVLRVPFRRAIGTSLVIIVIVSAVALATHLAQGAVVDWPITIAFAAMAALGSLAGASVAGRTPQRTLGQAFAVLLVGVALLVLLFA